MNAPRPSKEQQLLFNILKGEVPASLEGIDTNTLFDLFRRHRLFPLAPALFPLLEGEERKRWKTASKSGALRSMGLIAQLHEIIRSFNLQGITVIPLKGVVLAQALYGDVSQRHIRDLDLLVKREDVFKAIELLKKEGFVLKTPGKALSSRQWNTYFRHQYDVAMVHKGRGSLVELHTQIAYPGLLGGFDNLLTDRLESIDLAGKRIDWMSREATFLYLLIHGTHHLFFRLFWLRDLAEALNRWEIDHSGVLLLARQMGVERMLGTGLKLAHYYFGSPIPSVYSDLLAQNAGILKQLELRCHRAILDPNFLTPKTRYNVLLFHLALKPGWKHTRATLAGVLQRWYIRSFLVS